jgi:hypothetical protein
MYDSFQAFWPEYLNEHRKPSTRQLHFAGTTAGLTLLLDGRWILGVVVPYAFAWVAHFFVEGNAPATFRHPLLSLIGDFYLCWLMLAGRLEAEVARVAALPPPPAEPSFE